MLHGRYGYEVYCTFQFEALHNWPEAPEEMKFLRYPHRHLFHIECRCEVDHNDRDIEFLSLKKELSRFCNHQWGGQKIGHTSCEMIAEKILDTFSKVKCVTVSEDNENGSTVWRR